ncbi:cytochrome c oxidase subunit 2A [Effusibacillus dendaii]|uniref:Cytochrome c oxidase subunit 2A n=1 Tax=Effusibacillus dendaii TaxID=2743772 RepID=A0A7I8D9N9_9BACL|nr:cytochrome c oxidase subunit 2A [Effusibacillus dendaii]BCJ86883.1 hypothetical protein skT53_18680 [Effusibacillus dendaii]
MANPNPHVTDSETVAHKKKEEEPVLTGTLVLVLILGFLIVASWVGVFGLYVSRL